MKLSDLISIQEKLKLTRSSRSFSFRYPLIARGNVPCSASSLSADRSMEDIVDGVGRSRRANKAENETGGN